MHSTEQEHAAHKCTPKAHAGGPEVTPGVTLPGAGQGQPWSDPQGPTPGAPQCPQNKNTSTQEITTCTPNNTLPTNAPLRCMQEGPSWAGKTPGVTPGAHPGATPGPAKQKPQLTTTCTPAGTSMLQRPSKPQQGGAKPAMPHICRSTNSTSRSCHLLQQLPAWTSRHSQASGQSSQG